jgi:PAS domain S-box-containing protein
VESSDDAIIGKTLEGTITSWNGGAERIYGYSAEEAVGRSISMLVPPELSDEIPTILQKLRRGETIAEYETARITRGGRRLNISLTVSPIRDSSGEIVGASTISRDITGRKQTEVALRAGQEHLSRIVETVADGIVLVDRSGRITFANTAAEEMFGMRRASIARRTYNDPQWKLATLDNEPFPEEELPFVRVIDTGEPVYDVELALELSDGSRAILSVNGAPLRDANGDVTGMVASFSNITGRKRVEEELRRRDAISEVVRFAAECLLRETATWEQGVQEVLERFGHTTEVSRVYIFENFTGDDGELWATNTHEWVAPGVSSQIDNPLLMALPYEAAGFGRWAEALRQGETIHGHTREFSEEEQRELVAEGTLSIALVPIFVGEEWWGFIGFDECVRERGWAATELDALRAAADTLGAAIRRKETQQALRQERDFSSAVLDTAGALVVVMDREGRIVRFNRACESLTGYPFEEVRGRLYWELFLLPEERERVNAVMGDVRAGRYPTAHENHWVMRDGSRRLISWNNTALLDEWGEPEYLVGTGIDITERRQAEDELRESQRTLATLMSNLPGMAYRCRNDATWTMDFVSEGCLGRCGRRCRPPCARTVPSRSPTASLQHRGRRSGSWSKAGASSLPLGSCSPSKDSSATSPSASGPASCSRGGSKSVPAS